MYSCVTVSLVPEARGGPFVFWDDLPAACRAARELGFDAIEIFPPGPEAVANIGLPQLLADHGLRLAALGTGAGWVKHKLTLTHADPAIRRRARDFIRQIIATAGPLGAAAIIGSMQGRHGEGVSREQALAWLGEAVAELGAFAATFGVPLFYEPLNRFETNLCNTVEAGAHLIGAAGAANVKLLCDLFHMNIEEVDLAAALRLGGSRVGHIHLVDSNRRPAGLGHIPLAPIAAALREIGYRGALSAEALPYPDSLAAARQTLAAYRQFFV